MDFHTLLQEQIKKHLTQELATKSELTSFLKAISDSYQDFEKEKNAETNNLQITETDNKQLRKNTLHPFQKGIHLDIPKTNHHNEQKNNSKGFVSEFLNNQVSKRLESESQLTNTVELLKTLLDSLQSGILVEDENRNVLFTNQKFCDIFSIPMHPESMIGKNFSYPEERCKSLLKGNETFSSRIKEIVHDKKIVENEVFETISGYFLKRDYIPIFINDEHRGHLWKYVNVTQKIQTRKLLEQSEERSRLIMNASLNAIITVDCEGKIMFWNNPAETIFGWNREEVIGRVLSELIIPPQYVEAHNRGMKNYMKTGDGPVLNKHFEITALNRSGVEFPIEISIIPIQQNGETFFCSFIQDISERKKAESKLKSQEQKYRNIIANMNLGLMVVDNEEVIQFANQSFLDMSGYEMDEILGKRASDLLVSEESAEFMKSKLEMRRKGISDVYQLPVKNKKKELRWWTIGGAPEYDDKGELIGSIGIHLDITEQKQMEIDLQNEKIKAQEASKAKEIFLANMSHEIRTPLNAIIGFLRELEKQEVNNTQKDYIEKSTIASKHLLSIINNVLDISKIEAGEMSLEYEDFVFENSIRNVVNVLQSKAEQKGLTLTTNISETIHEVLIGDALRLEQILFNLVGNALKFTHQGCVSVDCELINEKNDSQELSISIRDTGIGIDKDFVDFVFRKFSQEDKAITRKFGGTGLGMAITKELVQLMGGRIEVQSKKNEGTTIRIILDFKKGSKDNLEIEHTETININIDNLSVLLVEDNDLNRMVAQNSLKYYNCKVTEAENGIVALDILKKQKFDVILMDIQMPEMDGIEATRILRNEWKLTTPIIALTANAFKTEIEKCRAVGMNDYITKPFDESEMMEIIAKHVGNDRVVPTQIVKTEKLYNLEGLQEVCKGEADFMETIRDMFVEQTQTVLKEVEKSISDNNFLAVYQYIHEIKPSVEMFGIMSIMDSIKELEWLSRETQDKNKMTALFELIKTTLQEVVVQLQEDKFKE